MVNPGEQTMPQVHTVEIQVNGSAVSIEGPRVTGLQIKEAAIAQGVAIQLTFVLSEELQNGRLKIVGDADVVTVTPQSKFVAVANDDNS